MAASEYLSTAGAALAEAAAAAPPADLRARALSGALARRAEGMPIDAADACTAVQAFDRTVADLDALLGQLAPSDWEAAAHREYGRVRDVVAHLVGVERLAQRWLDPADDPAPVLDHVAATRPVIELWRERPVEELRRAWHEAALAVAAAAAALPADAAVTLHDLRPDRDSFLITRTFELWAHAIDIAGGTGRALPRLDDARMRTMSTLLMRLVPYALARRERTRPDRTLRFVLTGPAGGCYDVPLHPDGPAGVADAVVVVDTVDVCRVAARRLAPESMPAAVEGDRELVAHVLAHLDAYARD